MSTLTFSRRAAVATLVLCGLAAAACSRKKPAPPPAHAPRPEAIGTLSDLQGAVELVGDEGARSAARPGPLDPNGKLVTGPGGRAVLQLADGSRLEVGENGEVSWQRVGEEVTLIPRGTVVVRHTPNKGRRAFDVLIKTPQGVVRIPREPVTLAVTVDDKRTAVDVRMGHIEVAGKGGKRIELRMGERIEMSLAGLEIIRADGTRAQLGAAAAQAPPTPTEVLAEPAPPAPPPDPTSLSPLPAPKRAQLVLAMASDLRVYGDRPREVTLTWPAGLAVTTVQVARDHHFAHVVLAGRPEGGHVNVTSPARGSTYWRVLDEKGHELRRGKARFVADPASAGRGGAAPAVVSDSGVAAKLYYQSVAPAVTLVYTQHPRAARYVLRVQRADATGGKPLFERTLTQTQHTVRAGVLRDGTYLWKVTPLDPAGKPLGEGRENRLTVTYDNAQVQLAIEKPRSGARVRGERVQVQGVAPLESQLFVNGQRAPLDRHGRFDFRVERAASLIFKVVTPDGNETFWVRGLRAGS